MRTGRSKVASRVGATDQQWQDHEPGPMHGKTLFTLH